MKIKISQWDGRKMHLVRIYEVSNLDDIICILKSMNDNNIHGEFEFIPENENDKFLLECMSKQ